MANRALTTPVTNLDFESIKNNLKTYLSGTSEFSDFDYEGSGISVLLDLLAYNTHYTGLYANMLASESFIDSAVLRRSVVSLAKNLGYVPDSNNAATAVVSVEFGTTSGVPTVIPKGTRFFATKDGTDYTFTTTDSYTIDKTSEPYVSGAVELRQGVYRSVSFIYSTDSNSTKIEILSNKVDSEIIDVVVMNSPTDVSSADITWKKSTSFIELTSTSKVYFVNENYRGNYEISFGDGILGQKPEEGSFITIIYFDTDGIAGNNIGNKDTDDLQSFTFGGIGGNDFDSIVTTVVSSFGGADREDLEKIRYAAPKFYQSQDRAVTTTDFEAIVLNEYSAAESVKVWGGEQNDPPMHGKVFVCILPKNVTLLSGAQKDAIKRDILDKKKIVSVTPEIVDPDYTFVNVNCNISYDSSRSFIAESEIKENAITAIVNYFTTYLGRFNSPFRYSVLSRLVDLSSNSIQSNRIDISLFKKIIPSISTMGNYSLDFGIGLNHPYEGYDVSIVKTSVFRHRDAKGNIKNCFIEDNGSGRLSMYTQVGLNKVVVREKLGTVDYKTGKVSMTNFVPIGTGELPYIKFEVVPDQRFDIVPKRSQVLTIDSRSIGSAIKINFIDTSTGND